MSISEARLAVVQKAFDKFDQDGSGVINLTDVLACYDPTRHPRVVDGSLSASHVKSVFEAHFVPTAQSDGKITWDEFLQYYAKMSDEVDRGRELDHDALFEMIVTATFNLDKDTDPSKPLVCLGPRPKGLAATRNMDLVWEDPDRPGSLLGYRAVVSPVIGCDDVPATLHPHLAISKDVENVPHRYLQPGAALLAPLDLMWEEGDSGELVGFKGIVLSSVDLEALPAHLRNHVLRHSETEARPHHYYTAEQRENPLYARSSRVYGVNTEKAIKSKLDAKVQTANGMVGGEAYLGKQGQFTRAFKAPYCSSGLSTATTKPRYPSLYD